MTEIERELRLAKSMFVTTKISISQQTAQPTIRTREEKFVVKNEKLCRNIVVKELKKSCRDIENSVATK